MRNCELRRKERKLLCSAPERALPNPSNSTGMRNVPEGNSAVLLARTQHSCNDAWIAPTINNGNDKQRFFFRCVGDQVIANNVESQWLRGKIQTAMA